MTGALALVGALLAAQIQTHPTGLKTVGLSHGRGKVRTVQILDKLYEQAGKPSLDFDFARYGDLHDNATGETSLVTFSRSAASSPGTYVASDGLIKEAAVNLALYSEQFDNAYWTKSRINAYANQISSPDGKQTADKIEQQTGQTNAGGAVRFVTLTGIHTASVYAKSAEKQFLRITTGSGTSFFDLSSCQAGTTSLTSSVSIEPIGDGWCRASVSYLFNGTSQVVGFYNTDADNNSTVIDSGGIYIWGAQLEEGTVATPYIRTTSQALAAPRFDHDPVTGESLGLLVEEARTNLFLNSATLATQTVTTTAAAHTLSFYGTGTVDLTGTHTATVVGTGAYPARTTLTFTPTAGSLTATVTGTVEFAQLEAGAFPTSYIPTAGTSLSRAADVAAVQDADFATTNLLAYSEAFTSWGDTNISRDSTTETAPDGQATALQISASSANGTVIYPAAMGTSAERVFSIYMRRVTGTGDIQYTLDNGSNWTTQAITSSWQRYIFPKSTAAQQPGIRIVTSGDAIEIWGASLTATEYPVAYTTTRNLLEDSQDFERSTWSLASATIGNDVTQAPDGTITADDATATGANATVRNATTTLAVSYTFSVWLKRKTGTGDIDISVDGTTWVTQSVTSAWQRFTVTQTGVAGTSNPGVRIVDSGDAVYLWGAQLEPGSTATDYVRTVDVVGKAYRWYEPTEGTVFVEADTVPGGFATQATIAGFFTSTTSATSRFIEAYFRPNGKGGFLYTITGGAQLAESSMSTQYRGKMAGAVKLDNANSAFDGTLTTLKTSVGIPTAISAFLIGSYPLTPFYYLNGHIKRLTYWPVRHPDATLQVITQ